MYLHPLKDFVSSVSTLLTVRSYTENLRERIQTLDTSVSAVGTSFASKKKSVLESKRTAANLDEAIDTLQACLRVLDLVNRVGEMIKEGKYWSALKVCLVDKIACFYALKSVICSHWKTSNPFLSLRCPKAPSLPICSRPSLPSALRSKTPSQHPTSHGCLRSGIPAAKLANLRWMR